MKLINLFIIFVVIVTAGCVNQHTHKYSFGDSINYGFSFKIKEVNKSGDFLVLIGESNEKIVISENFLTEVLNQINPTIDSINFFDLVYQKLDQTLTYPSQVLDFKNSFLDEEIISKVKRNKENSIIYLWELEGNRFKAIEVKKNTNYFLNIYAENYSKETFLLMP